MKVKTAVTQASILLASFSLSACISTGVTMGGDKSSTVATGSAGGAASQDANSSLERCDRPLGTASLLEDTSANWYYSMRKNGVQSTVPILRLLMQQSNCFVVVERGRGMSAMKTERELMQSGELRDTSNFTKGQMVAADYTITPTLIYSANKTSGLGGLGYIGALVGAATSTKDAQSMLAMTENRSGVQVAVAEGSSRGRDIAGILGVFGGGAGGLLGGYTKTPEGKVVVGAMTDAYNNLVKAVKNYKAQESSGPQGHGSGGRLEVK